MESGSGKYEEVELLTSSGSDRSGFHVESYVIGIFCVILALIMRKQLMSHPYNSFATFNFCTLLDIVVSYVSWLDAS